MCVRRQTRFEAKCWRCGAGGYLDVPWSAAPQCRLHLRRSRLCPLLLLFCCRHRQVINFHARAAPPHRKAVLKYRTPSSFVISVFRTRVVASLAHWRLYRKYWISKMSHFMAIKMSRKPLPYKDLQATLPAMMNQVSHLCPILVESFSRLSIDHRDSTFPVSS